MTWMAAALFFVLVGVNAFASVTVVRREDDPQRRRLQLALVWLLPFFGASAALLAHRPALPGGNTEPELDYTSNVDD
jgi:hypothetical protein